MVSLELGRIFACIVVVSGVSIGNRGFTARKVLEVNQHTLIGIEIP